MPEAGHGKGENGKAAQVRREDVSASVETKGIGWLAQQ